MKKKTRKCWCGLNSCIENFISGPAIEEEFKKINGFSLSVEEISMRDIEGEEKSKYIINQLISRISRSLSLVINIYDPDIIVLGGGVSNIERIYEDVPKIWNQWIFSDKNFTKLKKAMHGDSSGVRGAAWLK